MTRAPMFMLVKEGLAADISVIEQHWSIDDYADALDVLSSIQNARRRANKR